MIINWFGASCFKLQGDQVTLVTDPFDSATGLKLPRLAADIVTVSHDHHDHNNIAAVKGSGDKNPFVIDQPGEYEIKNTFVYGISTFHDNQQGKERGKNIVYRIEIDGLTIVHLGDLGHLLENGQTERLAGVDILLIPVGGNDTINAKQAAEIISQLEPRIVIPMHYDLPGLQSKLDSVTTFCKELGVSATDTVDKFKITKKDLPQDNLQVIILQP